jgi:hypothetical protein
LQRPLFLFTDALKQLLPDRVATGKDTLGECLVDDSDERRPFAVSLREGAAAHDGQLQDIEVARTDHIPIDVVDGIPAIAALITR